MKKTILQLTLYSFVITSLISCNKENAFKKVTAPGESENAEFARPNIIIILADDVGYEIPTYTGGESYSTPNLDYMAAHGTQFTQAHTAPLCFPSRIMLLTGKYNFRNYTTWGVLDPKNKTLANLAKHAGYVTCMAGKWQCDGGGASMQAFGFDKYLITNPYELDFIDSGAIRFYKDPHIFENGAYWPASKTKGKYGDDIIRDYMFHFIDSVKSIKPFLIYWATNLVHEPFCPTPDDPQFASWKSTQAKKPGDTIYFPSMVKYQDKLIGQLRQKLVDAGIANNTIIIWGGDNGTDADIHSKWKGQIVSGSKSSSTEAGTHVPMLAYCPGKVKPGFIDTSLISLVDYMPTVADLTQTAVPGGYGKQDGISFAPQFSGDLSKVRPWIFCHFRGAGANENNPKNLRRWMQDATYKQYDSLPNVFSKRFYNIKLDPAEKHPITAGRMTAKEKAISKEYLANMKTLH